ncbi:hypothetical protein JXA27_06865 [Aerococcaceae bacterium zg-B36]|uniref:hypothetical protein n=1 Tax=Aerococcaceae bacterium zg-252 TaxID=2796928 RepID=UPI001BD8B6EF|nr:hypothetical protein [Aerococcaceae bacterium zg-B36]
MWVKFKQYTNGAWKDIYTFRIWDATLKRWMFSSVKMQRWTGYSWTNDTYTPAAPNTKTQYVKEFECTWSQSYTGDNTPVFRYGNISQGKRDQGSIHSQGNQTKIDSGIERSLFGFDTIAIQNALRGKSINTVEIYLTNTYLPTSYGTTASLCTHNFTASPAKFDCIKNNVGSYTFKKQGEGRWISIHYSEALGLATGEITGFGLKTYLDDARHYGYFAGYGQNGAPRLRIRYSDSSYSKSDTPLPEPIKTPAPKPITPTLPPRLEPKPQPKPKPPVVQHPAKYTKVLAGEGLVQVTERLMRQGVLSQDFFKARAKLMKLNNFSTAAPLLHPNQPIMYEEAKYY